MVLIAPKHVLVMPLLVFIVTLLTSKSLLAFLVWASSSPDQAICRLKNAVIHAFLIDPP